jgi:hypothetical protein
MIVPDEQTSIREWASLFSGKLFAMIVVYADETGTGGIPKSRKEPAPGVCGYLARIEEWEAFRTRWKSSLKAHKAEFFHFRDLNKSERQKAGTPYFGWSDSEVDDFIYDMAFTASCCRIYPFGGNASVKMVHGMTSKKEDLNETYRRAFNAFFECFTTSMNKHFPKERGRVSFFFDDNQSEEWVSILDQVIKKHRKRDTRIGEYTPIEDTSERGMPCQAADLFAAINRQNNETIYELGEYVPYRVLDNILARQAFPEWHPFVALKKMSDADWENLVKELRARKKIFDLHHQLAGTTPKPQYYPIVHHPFFNHLSNICYEHRKKHPALWV